MKELWTLQQCADYCGVALGTVYNWKSRGVLNESNGLVMIGGGRRGIPRVYKLRFIRKFLRRPAPSRSRVAEPFARFDEPTVMR